MKATNIKWDIDLEDDETYKEALALTGLPDEVVIPENLTDPDDISDWLSDEYRFCHTGFDISE